MKHKEQSLFGEPTIEEIQPDITKTRDAVFNDYESFIAKFNKEAAKTTDDCYTPQDVYEAVVNYVGTLVDMSGRQIIRPFYPGGDYINTNYPPNGIVIDNPPFSIFTKICKFYTTYNIPFFLFGPGMTIGAIFKYCTAVILGADIKFTNGATVPCNFATNLMDDTIACTAPELNEAIKKCPSQQPHKRPLPKYKYPDNVVSISTLQTICNNLHNFRIRRSEARIISNLDEFPPGKSLFGDHLLVTDLKAKEAKEANIIHVNLSRREQRLVDKLNNSTT